MRRALLRMGGAVAAVVVATGLSACEPRVLVVTATPGLFPAFQSGVVDYVNRCSPGSPTDVAVEAPSGTTVAVAGTPARSGRFTVPVAQEEGGRFTIIVTANGKAKTHHVRCLPADFPHWSAERTGAPQAPFYAMAMLGTDYSAVFDAYGVPVHWLRDPERPILFTPLATGTFATVDATGLIERNLDGTVARRVATVGPADVHDVLLLPNRNYVMATAEEQPCDLTSWGLSAEEMCVNHVFQELTPLGLPLWTWDTAAHIPVTETTPYWQQEELLDRTGIGPTPGLYDPWHWNSVEATGDGFIMSFRHLDGVYRVDRASGDVVWKLGGTARPESLALVDDPLGGPAGQHDARLLADGSVSLFDNGNGRDRPPRAVAYVIDRDEQTATLVDQVADPVAPRAFCCGSTRVLPRGNWVTGWGGNREVTENRPNGDRVFRIRTAGIVYRAVPVLSGQFTRNRFRAGMDAMHDAAP